MKTKILLGLCLFSIIACDPGNFTENTTASINPSRPENDARCEGGVELPNNKILVPFEWSIEGGQSFESFIVNVYNETDLESIIATSGLLSGEALATTIELERGQDLIWQVVGTVSSNSEQVPSVQWSFYSESIPQEDSAPLPSRITIERRIDNFQIEWENERQIDDGLTYNVYRTTSPVSDSNTDLTNTALYTPISPDSNNETTIPFSTLPNTGDYIFRVETIKSIANDVQFRTDSYSRFTY